MRSRATILTAAVVVALTLTSCDTGTSDTESGSVDTSSNDSVASPESALTELIPLALGDSTRNLGMWIVNPSRTAIAYELRGADEVWAMDGSGDPRLVNAASGVDGMEFVGDEHMAITEQQGGVFRITYARVDGSEVDVVTESRQESRFIARHDGEIVYAQAANESIQLSAWDTNSQGAREIGSFDQEFPDLFSLALVGDHVVFEQPGDESNELLAMSVADGSVIALPQHDPSFRARLVGATPDGHAVLTEGRRGGGYIYTVDFERPEEMTDLTRNAVAAMVWLEGTIVEFVNTDDMLRQIDLVTGEASARPPAVSQPPGLVEGLEEDNIRLRATLDNGNWLVSGYLVDGAKYRTAWKFNEQFGGDSSQGHVAVTALFEYNPATKDLWQISGPPTIAATQTVSGAGVGPSGLLRVELLDGFVVFSTGFSGAAYDIEYNLYAAPIPSSLDS